MKIAIVSNKRHNNKETAKKIDECDIVVRFSNCVGWNSFNGKKTDVWVNRSDKSLHSQNVVFKETERERLSGILGQSTLVYSMYGFNEPENGWVGFGKDLISTTKCGQIIPVKISKLSYIHPNEHPTLGFSFLWTILSDDGINYLDDLNLKSARVKDNDFILFGWDFSDMIHPGHSPSWEQEIVNRWIEKKYFSNES